MARRITPRPRVVNIPVHPGMTIVSPGDMHYPIQDRAAVELMTRFMSDIKPDLFLLQGDTFDTSALSTHPKPADQAMVYGSLESEAESARKDLGRFAKYSKRAFIGPGNHEERVYRFVNDNPGLHGMEWFDRFKSALDGYTLLPRRYLAVLGRATVCHGHTLKGSLNRYSAATVLSRYPGQSTFYGHTHRVDQTCQASWVKGEPVEHMAATLGHMGDIELMDYTEDDPWRLGFGVWRTFRLPDRSTGFTFAQHAILRTSKGLVLHSPLNDKVYS